MSTVKFIPRVVSYLGDNYKIGSILAWTPRLCCRCGERPAQMGAECNQCYKEDIYGESQGK